MPGRKNTRKANKTPVKSAPNTCPVTPAIQFIFPFKLEHLILLFFPNISLLSANSRQFRDKTPRCKDICSKDDWDAKFTTENPPQVDQCAYQNPDVPPTSAPNLNRHSPTSAEPRLFSGMSHKHKGPSSTARETINLGLMSDAGEAAASKRAINNSPACVYTPSLTTRAEKTRPHSFQV